MYIDQSKKRFFESGGPAYLNPTEEWKRQFKLCDCSNCCEYDCPSRFKNSRFPPDAGGQGQCLPLAKDGEGVAFRNIDGTIVQIPADIVSALKN